MDPLEIFAKKVSQSRKKFAQKILVIAGLEPMSFCLSDLEKAVVAKWQWSSVTQLSVSAGLVPTYKIYKICQFVGLKKEVTTIVCVFLRKAPTKKRLKGRKNDFLTVGNFQYLGVEEKLTERKSITFGRKFSFLKNVLRNYTIQFFDRQQRTGILSSVSYSSK